MKVTYLRARQLEKAIFFYSLARDLRSTYCMREDFWSRTRRIGSSHLVLRRSTISSFWPYYVWELEGFLCLTFFIVSLLCNLNKILWSTEGNSSIIPPSSFLSVALELNGYLSD